MIAINLLDWREQRRVIQNNRFFVLIGLTIFMCSLLAFMLSGVINELIGSNQSDVAQLTSEVSSVEKKIALIKDLQAQKDLLLARRQVIESLEDSRPFVVRIFDNLARVVPAGVVLTELTRKDDLLTLIGTGDSNVDVSDFMKNIQKLRWVDSAKLSEIKLDDKASNVRGNGANATGGNKVTFKIEATLMSVDASLKDAAAKATIAPVEQTNTKGAKKPSAKSSKSPSAKTAAPTVPPAQEVP